MARSFFMRIIDKDGTWFVNRAMFPMQDYVSGVTFAPGEQVQVKASEGIERLIKQGALALWEDAPKAAAPAPTPAPAPAPKAPAAPAEPPKPPEAPKA